MIAATINLCGAFAGDMSKRGMYCNDRIRELLVKPYLAKQGIDTEGINPLKDEIPLDSSWRENVNRILKSEGYIRGPWMYKDPRMAHMWKVWDYAYPNAKWLIVRRRTGDIIESCLKTKYMVAYDDREGWLEMVHAYEKRFIEMVTEGVNCKIIWPERMVNGDYTQIHEVCEWLGLPWKEEALNFINPLLWGRKERRKVKCQ